MPFQLSVYTLLESEALSQNLQQWLQDDRYGLVQHDTETELLKLHDLIDRYGEANVLNADDTAFYCLQVPTRTVGPAPLKGKQQNKSRVTVLRAHQAVFIGPSPNPRCFRGANARELVFYHAAQPSA